MGRQMITTDAQYLGIFLLEPAVLAPEGDGLFRSATGEVEDVKRQDDVLPPPVLAQGNIALARRWERKIWGNLANFCRHMRSFLHELVGGNPLWLPTSRRPRGSTHDELAAYSSRGWPRRGFRRDARLPRERL